jgi:hypothetical protein
MHGPIAVTAGQWNALMRNRSRPFAQTIPWAATTALVVLPTVLLAIASATFGLVLKGRVRHGARDRLSGDATSRRPGEATGRLTP